MKLSEYIQSNPLTMSKIAWNLPWDKKKKEKEKEEAQIKLEKERQAQLQHGYKLIDSSRSNTDNPIYNYFHPQVWNGSDKGHQSTYNTLISKYTDKEHKNLYEPNFDANEAISRLSDLSPTGDFTNPNMQQWKLRSLLELNTALKAKDLTPQEMAQFKKKIKTEQSQQSKKLQKTPNVNAKLLQSPSKKDVKRLSSLYASVYDPEQYIQTVVHKPLPKGAPRPLNRQTNRNAPATTPNVLQELTNSIKNVWGDTVGAVGGLFSTKKQIVPKHMDRAQGMIPSETTLSGSVGSKSKPNASDVKKSKPNASDVKKSKPNASEGTKTNPKLESKKDTKAPGRESQGTAALTKGIVQTKPKKNTESETVIPQQGTSGGTPNPELQGNSAFTKEEGGPGVMPKKQDFNKKPPSGAHDDIVGSGSLIGFKKQHNGIWGMFSGLMDKIKKDVANAGMTFSKGISGVGAKAKDLGNTVKDKVTGEDKIKPSHEDMSGSGSVIGFTKKPTVSGLNGTNLPEGAILGGAAAGENLGTTSSSKPTVNNVSKKTNPGNATSTLSSQVNLTGPRMSNRKMQQIESYMMRDEAGPRVEESDPTAAQENKKYTSNTNNSENTNTHNTNENNNSGGNNTNETNNSGGNNTANSSNWTSWLAGLGNSVSGEVNSAVNAVEGFGSNIVKKIQGFGSSFGAKPNSSAETANPNSSSAHPNPSSNAQASSSGMPLAAMLGIGAGAAAASAGVTHHVVQARNIKRQAEEAKKLTTRLDSLIQAMKHI